MMMKINLWIDYRKIIYKGNKHTLDRQIEIMRNN